MVGGLGSGHPLCVEGEVGCGNMSQAVTNGQAY